MWAGSALQLAHQRVQIVGPDVVFGFVAVDDDVGGAAVAPVVQQHPVARLCDAGAERAYCFQRAAAAG